MGKSPTLEQRCTSDPEAYSNSHGYFLRHREELFKEYGGGHIALYAPARELLHVEFRKKGDLVGYIHKKYPATWINFYVGKLFGGKYFES